MRRRVRATFLLRFVILLACVAIVVALYLIAEGVVGVIGALVVLIPFWIVAIEFGVLPWLIERAIVRRAEESGALPSSPWIVEVGQSQSDELRRFGEATRDNPTIR